MKYIGIVGSRRRNTPKDCILVAKNLQSVYEEGDTIVSGGCREGGDAFAERLARDLGATIIIHHADWKKHGKAAGFVRNTRIAEDSDILIACVASDRQGGTEDTIRKYEKLGKNQLLLV